MSNKMQNYQEKHELRTRFEQQGDEEEEEELDIFVAASEGILEDLISCLNDEDDADAPDLKDSNDWTAIHHAALFGHLDIVKYLVEECDLARLLNQPDCRGNTPLHLGTEYPDMMKFMIEHGGDLMKKNSIENTPLHRACRCGNYETVKYFVKAWGDGENIDNIFYERNADGHLPIHLAAIAGSKQIVKYILTLTSQEMLLEKSKFNGNTPLHWACRCNQLNVVEFILQSFLLTKPKIATEKNLRGNIAIVEAGGADFSSLHIACRWATLPIVLDMIQRGNPKNRTSEGYTSLHCACMNGRVDIVSFLHKECRELYRMKDNKLCFPLHYAFQMGHHDVVKWFLDNTSCLDILKTKNSDNRTPIEEARKENHLRLAQIAVDDMELKEALDAAADSGNNKNNAEDNSDSDTDED